MHAALAVKFELNIVVATAVAGKYLALSHGTLSLYRIKKLQVLIYGLNSVNRSTIHHLISWRMVHPEH